MSIQPSDTPRTDACLTDQFSILARQLERELNELRTAWQEQTIVRQKLEKERDQLRAEVTMLHAANDQLDREDKRTDALRNERDQWRAMATMLYEGRDKHALAAYERLAKGETK